jgi:putative hydrolase of the HAD superfamily
VGHALRRRAPARGLLLDIGGVVLESGPVLVDRVADGEPELKRLLEPLGGIGGDGDEPWQAMLAGALTERAYWARRADEVLAALGRPVDGGIRALTELLFSGPPDDWLRAGTLDLMAQAKAAGLPLGALTNDLAAFHGPQWVEQQAWLRTFDVVVDASVTGVFKPDPRAFAAGAAALGLAAPDVVFLDDMPWNVEGGLAAGLLAVRMPHGDPAVALARARTLLGLPESPDQAADA